MDGQDLLRAILEHPTIGLVEVDVEGRILRTNGAIERLLGYGPEELRGLGFVDLTHPDDAESDWRHFRDLVEGRVDHYELEKRYVRKGGEVRWGRLSASPIGRTEAGPTTVLGLFQDVTDRKQAEAELRAEQANAERLWTEASSGIAILDPEGRVVRAFPGLTSMFGWTEEELVGRSLPEVITSGERREEALSNLRQAAEGRTIDAEGVRRHRDGREFPVSILGRGVRLPNGNPGVFVLFRDISDRKRLEAEMERLSTTDELTGLHNRRAFYELASHELSRARRKKENVSVIFIDLDRLKEINDGYGHLEGDRVLAEVGRILRESCRAADVVARLGGDEFAVLAVDASSEPGRAIPDRIREALARSNARGDFPVEIGLTIGTVSAPGTEDLDLDVLLRLADERMYRQKRRRRADAAAG